MIYNTTLIDYGKYMQYIVLLAIVFLIIIVISSAYIYFHWYLKGNNVNIKDEEMI